MSTFDAWHLPGLQADELALAHYQLGDLAVRAPTLTPDQLQAVLTRVEHARANVLAGTSATDIVAVIDAVAARLADRESAHGLAARTCLPPVTGYSAQTIEDVLRHMIADWSSDSLHHLLAAEIGDVNILDRPVPNGAGRHVFARGPRLVYQVFSGNVPGVAVTSLIRCLLVKAGSLGKTASGEPVLPVLFARALAEIAPDLADCIAITYWPGGTMPLENVALDTADAVVVYGGAETVTAIAQRTRTDARLIVHGPKLSIGLVGRAATLDVAPSIASAVAAYDQQGCVSPHVIYVERGGLVDPRQLARAIAASLETLAVTQPRRTLDAAEALAIQHARTSAEFRSIAGAAVEIFASHDTGYTVIYDDDAALTVSCLNRTVYVKPIEDAMQLTPLLMPHRGILQSAAIAGFSAITASELTPVLADCGVTRVTSFEDLPWPRMWWHHDGQGPLRELLTWHDLEL